MKKKIYELVRKQVARMATGKLGKVEIFDDEIICYVDGRKIKKKEKYSHRYNLIFKMINPKEELYKKYRVDKTVHYIIRNVDFDREINIQTSMKNCHVTFENCTFKESIGIDFADYITFIKNKYKAKDHKNYFSLVPEGHFYISTRRDKNEINNIEFIDDNIEVDDINIIPIIRGNDTNRKVNRKRSPIIKLWLYGKEVKFENTAIVDAESIEIGTDTLTLNSTSISSKEIEIDSENLIADTNTTIDTEIISIENNNEAQIKKIDAKSIFINGIEANKNKLHLDSDDLELQKKRLELINTLNKIELSCEETISEKIKKQPLTKVLKK